MQSDVASSGVVTEQAVHVVYLRDVQRLESGLGWVFLISDHFLGLDAAACVLQILQCAECLIN